MKNCLIFISLLIVVSAQEIVYYDEIKDLPNNPGIFLIDVREPHEIEATGLIPTAFNIPSGILEWSLNLISPKFDSLYSRPKPQLTDPMIFTCKSGKRALAAAEKAINLGYTNVRFYEGAWLEWCVIENLPCE